VEQASCLLKEISVEAGNPKQESNSPESLFYLEAPTLAKLGSGITLKSSSVTIVYNLVVDPKTRKKKY
jgi:hypothetical protein